MNTQLVEEDVVGRSADARQTVLAVNDLQVRYGDLEVLAGLDFDVRKGELVSVVGPSGAGKTTFIRCVAGLLRPTAGRVQVLGETVTRPSPALAVVFQDYSRSLMPWMTVMANVTFPLKDKGVNRAERRRRTEQALAAVGLADFRDHYPWQLSGGMQQRVAIARALAVEPTVLLMDEPFASVDAQTRSDLEDLILRVRDEMGMTIVFVTHDIDESVYLGDRVVVFSARPTTVAEVIDVDLPHPRDQVHTKELPQFATLRGHTLSLIRRARERG